MQNTLFICICTYVLKEIMCYVIMVVIVELVDFSNIYIII